MNEHDSSPLPMPYGLQFAGEPEIIRDEEASATKPNETYRSDTEDHDA